MDKNVHKRKGIFVFLAENKSRVMVTVALMQTLMFLLVTFIVFQCLVTTVTYLVSPQDAALDRGGRFGS